MREVLKDVKINCFKLKEYKDKSAINGRMKICYKCKLEKPFENYGKLSSSKDGYRYDCNDCRKQYRQMNSLQIKEKQKEYYNSHKEELLLRNKQYRIDNKSTITEQRKSYRERPEIKEHIKMKNKEYMPIKKEKIKTKRVTDNSFRINETLRSKFNRAIKREKYSEFIGCDNEFLKVWLEYRFTPEMSWDNFGTYWHIDHILPISKFNFNNKEEISICFHWTNLQPLRKDENISKLNKILLHYYFNNLISVFRFNQKYKQFMGYQAVNESLQWLRNKTSGMVKIPHMIDESFLIKEKSHLEIDNPQPSH